MPSSLVSRICTVGDDKWSVVGGQREAVVFLIVVGIDQSDLLYRWGDGQTTSAV